MGDRAIALLLLPACLVVIILIALAYLLTGHKNLLFKQRRVGWKGNHFTLWKFRTLSHGQELRAEQRRFPLGDFLRWSSLDELPQLVNVLKGEMSLIGPRPLPLAYEPLFANHHRKRFKVKPGITGWAQVNGRHSISWEKKFELDAYYVDHLSFTLDLKILWRTAILFFFPKKDVSLLEEEFKG